jgi:hypothetical protein
VLTKTSIATTNPFFAQDGTPLSGALITYELDRDDFDLATKSYIHAGPEQTWALDTAGLLPTDAALWPNTRGTTGSRWKIGIRVGKEWYQQPILVSVPESVTPIQLADLLTGAVAWPR